MTDASLIPAERIQSRILVLRGQRVLLDRDLAALYGVTTKRLNEQVRRNPRKFPGDFMFQLTREEVAQVAASRSQFATLKRGQNIKYLPHAFTEHGAIQAANVLNSDCATDMSVHGDLAALYGVTTKRLMEQVRRNLERFPLDFCFQLHDEEFATLRSQFATSNKGRGGRRYRPFAFSEHGALMAANVLQSPEAVAMSVHVVRAFVRLRQLLVDHRALAAKLAELDARVGAHDEQLAAIVDAIRQLTTPADPAHDRKIGYHRGNR